MKQLVQLKEHAEEFESQNAEVIAIFREEKKGVEGLKAIEERQKVKFTLALDLGKESTPRYSPGKMEFDNYVVDKSGTIRAIIDGKLTTRAQADQLLKVLSEINAEK